MPDAIPEADSSKSDDSDSKRTKMAIGQNDDILHSEED